MMYANSARQKGGSNRLGRMAFRKIHAPSHGLVEGWANNWDINL